MSWRGSGAALVLVVLIKREGDFGVMLVHALCGIWDLLRSTAAACCRVS